jgi:hypothetical protein
VRASLLYLLVGVVLGALLLAQKGVPYYPPIWAVFPLHTEFLLVGWLLQVAAGVAFWILPRFGSGPPRGDERLVLAAFILLNAGILLVASSLMLLGTLVAGRMIEAAAVLLFVWASWRRVKPHGV